LERLHFEYLTSQPVHCAAHVGVVGSGDLEILLEPTHEQRTEVDILTGSDGFQDVWNNVLTRFFNRYPIQAKVTIQDFGATPGVVTLRLAQALEALNYAE
jgi:malonate decarboxylase delta subunit